MSIHAISSCVRWRANISPVHRDRHIPRGETVNSVKVVDMDYNFFRIQSRKVVEYVTHDHSSPISTCPEHDNSLHFPIEDYGEHGAAFLSGNFLPLREEYTSFSSLTGILSQIMTD